jgi:hypothetical protein
MVKTNNTKPSTGKAATPASDIPDVSLWSEDQHQKMLASLSHPVSVPFEEGSCHHHA